jgi:hypothetical protein
MPNKEIEDIIQKYKKRLSEELGENKQGSANFELTSSKVTSREYEEFKQDILPPHFGWYEKACNWSEKIVKIKPDAKKAEALEEAIKTAHLNITPTGTTSLSIIAPLIIILTSILLSFLIPAIQGNGPSYFFIICFLLFGLCVMIPLQKLPVFLANSWRMSASNQMVLCVFYIVTYMRHTSNLELAIEFASNHLTGPLALDLKKVLWDIETEKYSTLKESLDNYIETWRKWNLEFIEAIHLIESSLFEGSNVRRLDLLDKSLDVILEETYEKMLHYAQNLKAPITTLHMLGIILPILGLVILPLVVNFMGNVKWYYIAMFYNFFLPIGVYYLGRTILAQRPTGYGETDITEQIPEFSKYKNILIKLGNKEISINPLYLCITIGTILFLLSFTPLILHLFGYENIGFGPENIDSKCQKEICFLSYREDSETGLISGPYDLISSIFSLLLPLSFAISIGLYYHIKAKNLVKIRENVKNLEKEFASALFQLGNRLGDGLPAEIAFDKAARIMQDSDSGKFFRQVSLNIQKLGMSIDKAIFDPKVGAITSYPSKIIDSSMKVLIQSIKKGPKIAAQSLINISRYIKEMHRVNERLKDLLSEVIASMKSQIGMLTPVIAGIVIGITSMITNILGKLGPMLEQRASEDPTMADSLPQLFGNGIPTYYFQIVVGLYVVQIILILTIMSNGIENGSDKLNEQYLIGKNMIRSGILYCVISLAIMIIFNFIADIVVMSI